MRLKLRVRSRRLCQSLGVPNLMDITLCVYLTSPRRMALHMLAAVLVQLPFEEPLWGHWACMIPIAALGSCDAACVTTNLNTNHLIRQPGCRNGSAQCRW